MSVQPTGFAASPSAPPDLFSRPAALSHTRRPRSAHPPPERRLPTPSLPSSLYLQICQHQASRPHPALFNCCREEQQRRHVHHRAPALSTSNPSLTSDACGEWGMARRRGLPAAPPSASGPRPPHRASVGSGSTAAHCPSGRACFASDPHRPLPPSHSVRAHAKMVVAGLEDGGTTVPPLHLEESLPSGTVEEFVEGRAAGVFMAKFYAKGVAGPFDGTSAHGLMGYMWGLVVMNQNGCTRTLNPMEHDLYRFKPQYV